MDHNGFMSSHPESILVFRVRSAFALFAPFDLADCVFHLDADFELGSGDRLSFVLSRNGRWKALDHPSNRCFLVGYNYTGVQPSRMGRRLWGLISLLSAIGIFIASTMTYYHYSIPERRDTLVKFFPFVDRLYPAESPDRLSPFGPLPSGTFKDPGAGSLPSDSLTSVRPDLPFCDVSGLLNCARVDNSRYSVFLGVPVPVLGLLGYLQFFLVSLWGLSGRSLPFLIRRYFVIIAGFALLFTGYLNYAEAFLIRAFCPWCIGATVVTLGITLPTLLKSKWLW